MAKISVMGTGSWGTALAILLHNNGHQVMLWSAHPEKAASLNETREDPKKLPGIKIPEEIAITGDEKKALDSPDIVVFASPSAYMRAISAAARSARYGWRDGSGDRVAQSDHRHGTLRQRWFSKNFAPLHHATHCATCGAYAGY